MNKIDGLDGTAEGSGRAIAVEHPSASSHLRCGPASVFGFVNLSGDGSLRIGSHSAAQRPHVHSFARSAVERALLTRFDFEGAFLSTWTTARSEVP